MQYREFGKTGLMVSAVGMGANRFKVSELKTTDGVERCAELVVNAANLGINFFDSASTYSNGKCEEILRLALPQIKRKCFISGKSSSHQEKTRDSVLNHIESSLKNIGIEFFDIYYMWSVKSIAQYEEIMSTGGAYEGVLAAKERGLVKHICFSSHASAEDTVKIIQEGAFEGVLVSYSLLNFRENGIILETAQNKGLGVAIMNPLGGGIIPQNSKMFSSAIVDGDTDVSDSALKFVYANPAVSTVLCGISERHELLKNVQSLSMKDSKAKLRATYVMSKIGTFPEFCSGCNYCLDCPKDIPISTFMKAYNLTRFKSDTFIYNRSSPELIKRGTFFKKIDGIINFENSINPCIKCGKCEKVCTQSLPIIHIVDEIYKWVDENCVTVEHRRNRFMSLIHKDYKKVGFYTAGVYTANIINLYKQLFNEVAFELFVFDSNPQKWGEIYLEDIIVRDPAEILQLDLDVLLITNFIHSDDIYDELTVKFADINVQKLHLDNDLPWFY